MKKYSFLTILAAVSLMLPCQLSQAQSLPVKSASARIESGTATLEMDVDLSAFKVRDNRAVVLIPSLVKEGRSLEFPAVGVYSHGRFYHYLRTTASGTATGSDETAIRRKDADGVLRYAKTIAADGDWSGADVVVTLKEYGCCDGEKDSRTEAVAWIGASEKKPFEYHPSYIYSIPDAPVQPKERSATGQARVTFASADSRVNEAVGNNAAELAGITSKLDEILRDQDITVTGITLKGWASPEGRNDYNTRLALARTQAIRSWIAARHPVPQDLWTAITGGENWDGLTAAVKESSLAGKQKILSLVESVQDPDEREAAIRKAVPSDYAFLRENVYPFLRRTDYIIEYTVRSYTTAAEVEQTLARKPENLSAPEVFLLGRSYGVGTDRFDMLMRHAAEFLPGDPDILANASIQAMKSGDLDAASSLLMRAGYSPNTEYLRGVLSALKGDWKDAERRFLWADSNGLKGAREEYEKILPALQEDKR